MKFFKEFKEFAIKGNMIDMAVGIIIGTAFKDVVDVMVKKIIMPPLSFLTDSVSMGERKWVLKEARVGENGKEVAGEIAIGYGEMIETFIDFLIIAMVIFIVIRIMNSLKRKAEDPKNPEEKTPADIALLSELKELMAEQNEILKNKQ